MRATVLLGATAVLLTGCFTGRDDYRGSDYDHDHFEHHDRDDDHHDDMGRHDDQDHRE